MSSNVIDNYKGNDLARYLNDVLPDCESGKFAVGYFFISGLDVIIENVKHLKELRFLISNTTNQKTAEILVQAFKRLKEAKEFLEPDNYQDQERINEVMDTTKQNLTESLERMKQDDSEENTIKTLLDLMSPEKKIIKVRVITDEKLHAKAYLLKLKKGSATRVMRHEGYGVVGSSNLSLAGLKHSSELNLVTLEKSDYDHLSKWFNRLWDNAQEFTEKFNEILGDSWAGKVFNPYDVYMKGIYDEMKERLGAKTETLVNPFGTIGPDLFEFQLQAVHQSVHWLLTKNFRGMIIADVVGLGKTFVATGIAKLLQMREALVPLIICPPVLEEMWKNVMKTYQIHAEFLSRGELSKSDHELWNDYTKEYHKLIIVDESHHFRHSNSNQYQNLKKYLDKDEDRKVILITATPLGTSIQDIFNQIKLFHKTDELIVPVGTTSLKKFEKGVEEKRYDIRDLLKQIMIRRTRKYVLETFGEIEKSTKRRFIRDPKNNEKIFFPDRKLETLTYDVDKVYNQQYDDILELLTKENLKFARYGLGKYVKEYKRNSKTAYKSLFNNGPALIGLVRMLLLKRLESSFLAFKNTVRKMIFINTAFLQAINDGIIPSGDEAQKILYESADDFDIFDVLLGKNNAEPEKADLQNILKELKDSKSYFPIEDFNISKLKQDLKQDLITLNTIYEIVKKSDYGSDDKFAELVKVLKKHPKEKILIFSEYADTAQYIWKRSLTAFPKNEKEIEVIHSKSGGAKEQNKIAFRFAPKANQSLIREDEKFNPIRILVSTDVMSEGTNLQDAGIVINYDIHWNFVRLIQRAGRIDRIGQEREVITLYSFLPAPKVEIELSLHARVRNCIDNYMRVIGDDSKVLEESERLNKEAMYAINVDKDAKILDTETDWLSSDKLEKKLQSLQNTDKQYYDFILKMQDGIRTGSKKLLKDFKNDIIVVAFQAGLFKKYYQIDLKGNVSDINWQTIEGFLQEDNKKVKPITLPKNYSKLIQKAYSIFEKEVKKNKAKLHSGLGNEQLWLLDVLRKFLYKSELKKLHPQIDYLIDNFKKKISNNYIKIDLRKLKTDYKNENITDNNLIKELSNMILSYPQEFLRKDGEEIEETEISRILYSKFVKLT